jgi:hypothetical protein
MFQITAKYTKRPYVNIPNGHYVNMKHFLFQGPPKFTQIGIFGMQIYHLATDHRIFLYFSFNVHLQDGMESEVSM